MARPDKYKETYRLLLVENSWERQSWFLSNVPENVRVTPVESGQMALGIIKRMLPNDYAAILLDCDLDELLPGQDNYYDGVEVTKTLIQYAPRRYPVLIHSHNPAGAARMLTILKSNGWDNVTRIPFRELSTDPNAFRDWILELEEELGVEFAD